MSAGASGFPIEGVLPILQTPFHESGALDLESLAAETDWVIRSGAPALVFPGFVSEWWKLTPEEVFTCAQVIRGASAGRARLVLNVTSQSTFHAVEQAKSYMALGADALMVLPPFVVPPRAEAAAAHLRAVLEAAPLPHILQYSASLTGLRMSVEEMLALHREFPHFRSIKIDYIPPGPMISKLAAAMPPEFTFLTGYAGLQLDDSLRRGAHGMMPGSGHIAEDLRAYRALKADPEGEGAREFQRLLPLLNLEMQTIDTSIALHKRMLFERGVIASPHVRQPGPSLDEVSTEAMRAHLRRLA
jgi:dihydrodipicolinate synthase/N-acetylneuraminate lyase